MQKQELEKARQEALQSSRRTIKGQVAEAFAPFLPDFPYNPKDARFIGHPIDYIVFDGLSDDAVRAIVLLEIKSGSAKLNEHQRELKELSKDGHLDLRFEVYRVNT
jgi:predicted Holliday junction resolvase-like endonuclease